MKQDSLLLTLFVPRLAIKVDWGFLKLIFSILFVCSLSIFLFYFFSYSQKYLLLKNLEKEIDLLTKENKNLELEVSSVNLSEKISRFVEDNNFVHQPIKKTIFVSSGAVVKK